MGTTGTALLTNVKRLIPCLSVLNHDPRCLLNHTTAGKTRDLANEKMRRAVERLARGERVDSPTSPLPSWIVAQI